MFTAIITVLISGSCAVLAAIVAVRYQANNAGKIRREEVKAEKEEEARREALCQVTELISKLVQEGNEQVLQWMDQNIRRIIYHRPYLPATVVDNWMSIRGSLRQAQTFEATLKDLKGPQQRTGLVDRLAEYKPYCEKLADEALAELEHVMGLKPIELKYPPESK